MTTDVTPSMTLETFLDTFHVIKKHTPFFIDGVWCEKVDRTRFRIDPCTEQEYKNYEYMRGVLNTYGFILDLS